MLRSHSFIGVVLNTFFLFPLKAISAVRIMVKEIRFRMNVIASTYEDVVFSLNFSAKTFWKWVASSPAAPLVLKTSGVKLASSISRTRSLSRVFLIVSFCFRIVFWRFIHVTGQFGWVTLTLKKDFYRGCQKLRHNTSSLAFSSELAVRERISPEFKV